MSRHSPRFIRSSLLSAMACVTLCPALAQADPPAQPEAHAELAKQLANPIAALISIPLQYNYDHGIGDADGHRSTLNIQPVLPLPLGADWNVISRTILPLVDQTDVAGASGHQTGIGDLTQSAFLSPKVQAKGVTWGLGPVLLLPTASDTLLGTAKWGIGPTGVAVVQHEHWTVAALVNHIWSFAGPEDRADVSNTFLQPVVSYILPTHTTLSVNAEATYDWELERWSVPLHLTVSQLFKIGGLPMQLGVGARYWIASPDSGPEGLGFRAVWTLLLPTK